MIIEMTGSPCDENLFPGIMLINDLCFELDIYSVVCIILQFPFFADIINLDFEPAKELDTDSKKSIYKDIAAIVQRHGPLARYAKSRVRMRWECRERFPRHRR